VPYFSNVEADIQGAYERQQGASLKMRSEVFQECPFLDPSERFEKVESPRDDEDDDQNGMRPSTSMPREEQLVDEIKSLRIEIEYLQAMKIKDDMRQKVQALRTTHQDTVPTLENVNIQRNQCRNEV